jgi:glutathione synthase/RimK-type ligase-like ATP-grasp enzyme
MNVAIIGSQKTEDLNLLKKAFEEKGFKKAPFLKISKIGLFTSGNSTKVVVGTINFKKYDAVFLKAHPKFTAFVEPFLDELVEEGIYCQLKPESYYIMSNRPFSYAALNSRGVKTQNTLIFPDPKMIDESKIDLNYPLIVKSFIGHRKTQSLVVDSERGLKSFARSIKSKVDCITLQEYLEGDLLYCFVIGKDVFGVKRKWDAKKFDHVEKGVSASISETDAEMAKKAARACGADIATVKIIDGLVLNVSPEIDLLRFNNVLGKELHSNIASHYWDVLSR